MFLTGNFNFEIRAVSRMEHPFLWRAKSEDMECGMIPCLGLPAPLYPTTPMSPT